MSQEQYPEQHPPTKMEHSTPLAKHDVLTSESTAVAFGSLITSELAEYTIEATMIYDAWLYKQQ